MTYGDLVIGRRYEVELADGTVLAELVDLRQTINRLSARPQSPPQIRAVFLDGKGMEFEAWIECVVRVLLAELENAK